MLSTVPTRRELIAWLLAFALLVTQVVTFRSRDANAGVPSKTTQVVYLATGENFPDALVASAAAALGIGPVLLVQQNMIPQPTLDELNRLAPRDIVIVGGLAVISQGVEDDLNALLLFPKTVTRISGANRYETAAALSLAIHPTSGLYPRVAFVNDDDLSDGSAGSPGNVMTTVIEAPVTGILVIEAGADVALDTNPAIVTCWITINGDANKVDGSFRTTNVEAGNPEEDCSTQVAMAVAPGAHVVRFRVNQDSNTFMGEGSLTVVWIPFGSHGHVPSTAAP